MSNHSFNRTRPNSCPDPWRKEAETMQHTDRPSSVLAGQDVDGNKRELPLDSNRQSSTSDNGEFNKAQVNRWIRSEAESDVDSDVANRKPSYHYPQRRSAPGIASEYVGTRPQTEPGRSRDQEFSENIKTRARQSVHDVGSSSPAPSHETEQGAMEDWVVVEKSSSDTIMPCDPEDESNILVPSPNKTSTHTDEQDSEDNKERTRMVLSNNFGSTFEVLPQIPDRSAGPEGLQADTEGKDNTPPDTQEKRHVTSFGYIGTFAASIMKWKRRRGTAEARLRVGYASLDLEHQEILASEADTIKTEVPEALMRTIKEEAYKIVFKTTQAYRSQIGGRHKLTCQAFECLKELKEELQK